MGIKITSAQEAGIGRLTPGAIPEGLARPVPLIRTGVGLDVAQGLTELAGTVVSAQIQAKAKAVKQAGLDRAMLDNSINKIKVSVANLDLAKTKGRLTESLDILKTSDLSVVEYRNAFNKLVETTTKDLNALIPPDLKTEFDTKFLTFRTKVQSNFADFLTKKVNDTLISDADTLLSNLELSSAAIKGFEDETITEANKLIDGLPEDKTVKVARKAKFANAVRTNQIKNRFASGSPEQLLVDLNAKTESGGFAKFKGISSSSRILFKEQARSAIANNRGFSIANDIWDKQGAKDKMDIIDIEKITDAARRKTTNEKSAKVAVARLKERNIIHNQAREAVIKANKAAIWEAFDGGVDSGQILRMPEFIELPAKDRINIENEMIKISDAQNKPDTFALRVKQVERFQELARDPGKLRSADLRAEFRNKSLSESDFNALTIMEDTGSLKSVKSKAAFKILLDSKNDNLFNTDEITNAKVYADHVKQLQDFIIAHPNGDPFKFVRELLKPVEIDAMNWLFDLFASGSPSKDAATRAKAEKIRSLKGKVLDTATAQRFLNEANGNRDEAERNARKAGFNF